MTITRYIMLDESHRYELTLQSKTIEAHTLLTEPQAKEAIERVMRDIRNTLDAALTQRLLERA